jgi:hypothetical protein
VERDGVFDPAAAPTVDQMIPELSAEQEWRREVERSCMTVPAACSERIRDLSLSVEQARRRS